MLTGKKSRKGQSLVELCAILLLLIPIFFLVFDCVMMVVGLQVNEKTCREAARIAASGDPSTAKMRAQSIIDKTNDERGWMIEDVRLVSIKNRSNSMDIRQPDESTALGVVEVTTAVDIRPYFITRFLPNQQSFTFTAQQSFPYTYIPQETPSVKQKSDSI